MPVNTVRQGIGNFFKLVTEAEVLAVLARDHLKRIDLVTQDTAVGVRTCVIRSLFHCPST